MATAKITLIGFYQWMKANNDDLFANLSVPSGVDRSKLINTILMNGAEFEVLYGDADYFKFLIGPWSDKWYRTMDRWAKALNIDYAPLENYDRQEEWNDIGNSIKSDSRNTTDLRNTTDSKSGSDSRTENDNTVTTANSTSSGSGSNENKKSAYDSNTYSPYEKSETSSSGNNTSNGFEASNKNTTGTLSESGSRIESGSRSENGNEINSNENVRTGRAHGNIGVTTSQQMLESELDISRFNLYDEIAALFLTEFCIYTY